MTEQAHLSIGEVLAELSDEFPDITISKIRFLESQGLVNPERTPSGYRKFYAADLVRLRWILHQQKEHFLPLKVIKERLDQLPPGDEALLDPAPATDLDVRADVWSAPSCQQLRDDALECERWNRLHPTERPRVAYVSEQNLLPDDSGEPIRHSQVAEIFVKDKSGSYRPRNPSLN